MSGKWRPVPIRSAEHAAKFQAIFGRAPTQGDAIVISIFGHPWYYYYGKAENGISLGCDHLPASVVGLRRMYATDALYDAIAIMG